MSCVGWVVLYQRDCWPKVHWLLLKVEFSPDLRVVIAWFLTRAEGELGELTDGRPSILLPPAFGA